MAQPLWNITWQFSYKTIFYFSIPIVSLLCIHPKELENNAQKACTQMIIAALFILIKNWKQLRWPATGG